MWVTSDLETALTPTAIALGNFDGVHRGHQQVVVPVVKSKTYQPLMASAVHRTALMMPQYQHLRKNRK